VAETIPALLLEAAHRNPDAVWLRCDDGTATFATALSQVGAIADRFSAFGVRPGDLVVVTTRTTPPYLLCWLALAWLGAICVPTDPSGQPREFAGLVAQVRPRLIVSDADATELTATATATSELGLIDIAELVPDWRVSAAGSGATSSSRPDDVVVLIPTSGTTGRSKLVMQTQRAYAMAGEGFPYWMELDHDDRLMTSLPLFHINAAAYSALGSLACGAGLVLLPRFSASGFLDAARRHGATEFNAIGAMLEILTRQPERHDDADNPLRLCYTGPSPAKEWQEAFERRFGMRLVCGYGLSESPYGLIWRHGTRPFGTLGSIRQHPTLGVVNEGRVIDDVGAPVGVGDTGELLLRNPAVTPGYWEMPDVTAQTIIDGWLHTGDLVTVNDDDTYTFVARKKEVLRRRGLNLSPSEVEEAIASHPDVLEVAVVGVPSELTEEEVKAFVVAAPGRVLDFRTLHDHVSQLLSAFKVPRYWQQLDVLPRTPTARVAKHQLPKDHPRGEVDAETEFTPTQLKDGP
jgi:crotonobetaine/carnitine-CoA ligase